MDLKKKFKKSLYDRRLRYGRLCNLGFVNQNLRINKHFQFEESIKDDDKMDFENLEGILILKFKKLK